MPISVELSKQESEFLCSVARWRWPLRKNKKAYSLRFDKSILPTGQQTCIIIFSVVHFGAPKRAGAGPRFVQQQQRFKAQQEHAQAAHSENLGHPAHRGWARLLLSRTGSHHSRPGAPRRQWRGHADGQHGNFPFKHSEMGGKFSV